MARKRNQLKDLERDERKNKSCRGDGRGARESAGKHGAGEKGEERRGLGGKPLHECLRGNCGLESLRGVIAQKHQRLEEVCGTNWCLWSQMAWDVASGSVIYCEVM